MYGKNTLQYVDPKRSQTEATTMTKTTPSEVPKKASKTKRRFLTAEKKFQIYLEAQSPDKPVGKLLRREGLFATDLARIRQQVKEGALQRLSAKSGRRCATVNPSAYDAIKRELQDKERALADLRVELAILRKKDEWGLVGPITKLWIKAETKLAILAVIETSQQQGVSARRCCSILRIEHRRVVRWQQRARQGQGLEDRVPGPKEPLHRILPEEVARSVAMAKS